QAEDGIRDWSVTGVQTCALPISPDGRRSGRSHGTRPLQLMSSSLAGFWVTLYGRIGVTPEGPALYNGLTLFLRVPGAPLDNNICERALKKVVLLRKNALFYRTQHGADVGDLF